MIIDIHTHIGKWDDANNFSVMDLIGVLGKNSVDYFVVSNLDGMGIDPAKSDRTPFKNELDANIDLVKAFKNCPQALLLAVCEPRHGSPQNLRQLLSGKYKRKFVGLKFHPDANQIPANSELYDDYFKIAKEYDLPCLFHSGSTASPYCSPALIYELAQRHPDVRVILGHLSAGDDDSKRSAIAILKESVEKNNSKLYCDISFCGPHILVELMQNIPDNIDRIMFGTDCPMLNMREIEVYNLFLNDFVIAPIRQVYGEKAEGLIRRILYSNAKKFFKIK